MNIKVLIKKKSVLITLLIAITAISYLPLLENSFIINYDDSQYIIDNCHVSTGISFENIKWAFTTVYASNYHPLTWVSHMLIVSFGGLNPQTHHIISFVIHISNVLLLLLFFLVSTRSFVLAYVMAMIFAIHPSHVESVAWAAELKDLLSTLFCLASLNMYLQFILKKSLKYYLLSFLFFVLSLLCKQMYVTLPFLIILLELWPIKRENGFITLIINNNKVTIKQLLLSLKYHIPFFAVSVIFSVLIFIAQKTGGAMVSANNVPVVFRVYNLFISYNRYIIKIIIPQNSVLIYPYLTQINLLYFIITTLIIISISAYLCYTIKKNRIHFVGWFWFIGSLIPVIGIIQVGCQSIADRYTYFSSIGITIFLYPFVLKIYSTYKKSHRLLIFLAIIYVSILSYKTFLQTSLWKNDDTLYTYTLKHTNDNYAAMLNYGKHLLKTKKNYSQSIKYLNKAYLIRPSLHIIHNYLSEAYLLLDSIALAEKHAAIALEVDQHNFLTYYNNALIARRKNDLNRALYFLQRGMDYTNKLNKWGALNNMGNINFELKNYHAALKCYTQSYKLNPVNIQILLNKARTEATLCDTLSALKTYAIIINRYPQNYVLKTNVIQFVNTYLGEPTATKFSNTILFNYSGD